MHGYSLTRSLTLIANVASYFSLFKDLRTFNKREGRWIIDSYILAVAQNMKRIGNLFASHLQASCEKEQPRKIEQLSRRVSKAPQQPAE